MTGGVLVVVAVFVRWFFRGRLGASVLRWWFHRTTLCWRAMNRRMRCRWVMPRRAMHGRVVNGWPIAMRRAVMAPVIALAVPGTVAVVTTPVRAQHEAHDRNSYASAVGRHEDSLVLVSVLEVVARNPAAHSTCNNVAPDPSIDATLNGYRRSRRQDGHTWIARLRAGAQIHVCGDVPVRREGHYRKE